MLQQLVVTSTIPIVSQNCFIVMMKWPRKIFRKALLKEDPLHVPFINAMFVKEERTSWSMIYNLQSAGVVPRHTIENAYQG